MDTKDISTQNPLAIVVFGGTGDLARKKLYPALYRLFEQEELPENFVVIGFARSQYDDQEYQQFVHDSLQDQLGNAKQNSRKQFCSHLRYVQGNVTNDGDYKAINNAITAEDDRVGQVHNRMFYLAMPPRLYSAIFENLSKTKLAEEKTGTWVRLLVEKPFGRDLQTARELDSQLRATFDEHQIFRIDHYLAKTVIQNIIAFRFSNYLFEGSWDRDSVKKVHIRMFEDFGIDGRGAFYDSVGALRDVGQNHILQMLALTSMNDPQTFAAQSIRDARAETLASLRLFENLEAVQENTVRAQHEGYNDIEGVQENSTTETYFKIRTFIDNDRWKGVPFFLESGKRLAETRAEIEVVFDEVLPCVCGAEGPHGHENIVTIQIKPKQMIDVRFWTRKPGMRHELEEQHMRFSYDQSQAERVPEAYEKILYDSIVGDQTLFARGDEVAASWEFITPILEHWENTKLHHYTPAADLSEFEFASFSDQ